MPAETTDRSPGREHVEQDVEQDRYLDPVPAPRGRGPSEQHDFRTPTLPTPQLARPSVWPESTRSRGEVLAAVDALDAGLTIKELRRRERGRLGLGRPGRRRRPADRPGPPRPADRGGRPADRARRTAAGLPVAVCAALGQRARAVPRPPGPPGGVRRARRAVRRLVYCQLTRILIHNGGRLALNNDAAVKAKTWLEQFGTAQMVPAAMLAGVFKLHNLEVAQRAGLTIWWSQDNDTMLNWIERTRP